jgi:multiple sugar transport system permease protein
MVQRQRFRERWFSPRARGETLAGYLLIAPILVGFFVFVAVPMLSTFGLSFFYYDLLSPPEWAGLDHFSWMLQDGRLHTVLWNTLFFTVFAVIGNTGLAVVLAAMLNQRMPTALRTIFRAAYFFPALVGLVFVAVIWKFLYHKDLGIINFYLSSLGIEGVAWLSNRSIVLWSVIILDVWKNVGFGMLIALAGLQGISPEYYDAARIDGASPVRQFFNITLPLLSPTILFLLVMNTIGAFRVFDSIKVLTDGGPGDASRSIVMYIHETGFQNLEMGYASAISIVLLAMVGMVTAINFILSKRWTFYE